MRKLANDEIPALRMELAFLRADLQSLEERFRHSSPSMSREDSSGSELPDVFEDEEEGFERSALELPAYCPAASSADLAGPSFLPRPARPELPMEAVLRPVHKTMTAFGARSALRTDLVVVDGLEAVARTSTAAGGRTRASADLATIDGRASRLEKPSSGLLALSLEPNIWDCAVMCALYGWHRQHFGKFNLAVSNLLLLVNVVVQFLFVLVMASMIQDAYEIEAMLSYRLLAGHTFDKIDPQTFTTRIQQVCMKGWYDQVGNTLSELEDYLTLDTDQQMMWRVPGQVVCLLAMFTWTVSIYSELRRLSEDLLLVIMALPVRPEVETEPRGHFFVITGAPMKRKAFCMLILFSRAVIAVGLLIFGLSFLVHTKEVVNLLTNAVALEFVRRIDELLFEAIVPRKLMGYVKVVKIQIHPKHCLPHEIAGGRLSCTGYHGPESPRPVHSLRMQNCWVLIRVLWILGVLLCFYFSQLLPLVSESWRVYNTLCGSNLDFVYNLHPVTGLPVFASVNLDVPQPGSTELDIGSLKCFYAATYEMLRIRAGFDPMYSDIDNLTLRSLLNGSNPVCQPKHMGDDTPCLDRDLGYLSTIYLTTWQSYFKSRQSCKDQDAAIAVIASTCLNNSFIRRSPELAFFRDISSCADFLPHCLGTRGNRSITLIWKDKIGKICPVTCGACNFGRGASA